MIRLSSNFVFFILLFGIGTLGAIRSENWILVVLFALVSPVFLIVDYRKR